MLFSQLLSCGCGSKYRMTKKEQIDLHDDVSFWIWKTIAQKYKVFPEGANKKDCQKVLRGEKVVISFGIEFLKDDSKYPFNLETRHC